MLLAASRSPDSIVARRQKANGRTNRPPLVLTPQASEAESCTTEGVLPNPVDFRTAHGSSDHDGSFSSAAAQPGRELLPPPQLSPRVRKMARQNMEVGKDMLQGGVEEAGSLGWFLQRRGGSTGTPKRRKSNEGLSFSFMSRFGTLGVNDPNSPLASDPASFRNEWKASHSFSDSASSAVSSFNGSFGSHTTTTTVCHDPSLDSSRVASPLGVVAQDQSRTALSASVRRRRSWIAAACNTGSAGSLTGKRQRSPGGMAIDEDSFSGSFLNPLNPGWGLFGAAPAESLSEIGSVLCSPSVVAGSVHDNDGFASKECMEEPGRDVVPQMMLPPKGGKGKLLKDHKAYSL